MVTLFRIVPSSLFSANPFCANSGLFRWKTHHLKRSNSRSGQAILINASGPPQSTKTNAAIHPSTFWPIVDVSTSVFQTASHHEPPQLKNSFHEPRAGKCSERAAYGNPRSQSAPACPLRAPGIFPRHGIRHELRAHRSDTLPSTHFAEGLVCISAPTGSG